MERDFRKGFLEIDYPVEPFGSIGAVLARSTRLFVSTLGFLTAVTVPVFLMSKLALQLALAAFEVPSEGVLAWLLMDLGDLVFSALVIPAAIYGLVAMLRTGKTCPAGEALRWGRRVWGKALWNKLKVEVTVTLWSALLLVPGIVAMVKLSFVDAIVAIEADRESEVLRRSRDLSKGRLWRIFLALLPALPLSLIHMYAALRALQYSRWLMVPVDSLLAVLDHWMTVVILLMYLGVADPRIAVPAKRNTA